LKVKKLCVNCSKTVHRNPKYSKKQWERARFCSLRCSSIWKCNHGIGAVQSGKPSWNKGTKGVMKANSGSWVRGDKRISGENNYQWSGEYPKYHAVHHWVYKQLGKAVKCEFCDVKGRSMYHWSNISGEYCRDINDWQQLCVPCHSKFDKERGLVNVS
jgi:hypothetical protein